jgi:heme/copper-type cytochrome/quinol oxidase subunit 4
VNDRSEKSEIIKGILITLGMNLTVTWLLFMIGSILLRYSNLSTYSIISFMIMAIIGIIQLVYIIPYAIHLKQEREIARMKGVIIGAVITFLINGGCWLLFPLNI